MKTTQPLILFTLVFALLMIAPAMADVPTFDVYYTQTDGSTADLGIVFNVGVGTTSGGTGDLIAGDFDVTGIDGLSISSVTHTAGRSYVVLTMNENVNVVGAGEVLIACAADAIYNEADACVQGATDVFGSTQLTAAPTVTLTDNHPDFIVRNGDTVQINATFSAPMSDSPQITLNAAADNCADIGPAAMTLLDMDGEIWTYEWTVPAACDDTVTVTVSGTDFLGNEYAGADDIEFTVDNTAPTGYSVVFDQPFVNAGNQEVVSFTFAGAEVGATYNYEITSDGGAGTVSDSDLISTATDTISNIDVSSLPDGTLTLAVTLTDAAGNEGAEVDDTVTKDTAPPTYSVTYSSDPNPVKSGDLVTITVTFSEDMDEDIIPQIALAVESTGDPATLTATDLSRNSPTEYAYVWTVGSGDGDLIPEVTVGQDLAGNAVTNTGSTRELVTVDNTAPTLTAVSITSNNAVNTNFATVDDIVTLTFTASEQITDVVVTINGNAATAVEGVDNTWQAQRIMNTSDTDGVITFTIDYDDLAGNEGAQFTTTTDSSGVTFDETPPTISSIEVTGEDELTVTFSEQVTGVVADDFTGFTGDLEGCDAMSADSGGEIIWTISLSMCGSLATDASGTVTVNAGAIIDRAGNAFAGESGVTAVDAQPPLVLSAETSGLTTIVLTVSEEVADDGFAFADFTVNGVTGATVTGAVVDVGGMTITLTIDEDISDGDTITVDYDQNTGFVRDLATNPLGDFLEQLVDNNEDTTPPEVVSVTASDDSVTRALIGPDAFTVTVVFDEDMNTGVDATVSFTVAAEDVLTNCSGAWDTGTDDRTWIETCDVAGFELELADVDVTVSNAQDEAGNTMDPDTTAGADNFDIDTERPTVVTLTTDISELNIDNNVVEVTITFSEEMSTAPTVGFSLGGFVTVGDGAWTVGSTVWTESFTAPADAQEVDVDINVEDAQDAVGNEMLLDTFVGRLDVDTRAPTVTDVEVTNSLVTLDDDQQQVTVTFSEDMDQDPGVEPVVMFSGAGTWSSVGSGSWTTATTWVQTFESTNTVEVDNVDVIVNNAQDIAGNTMAQHTEDDQFNIDTLVPTLDPVSIVSNNAVNTNFATVGDLVTLTFTASEQITDVVVTIDGNAATAVEDVGNTWQAQRIMNTSDTEDVISFTIDYEDMAGNAGVQVVGTTDSSSVTFDETPPSVTVISVSPDTGTVSVGGTVTVAITADAAGYTPVEVLVNGVDVTDDVTDETAGAYQVVYTVAAGHDGVAENDLAISVVFADDAGNENAPFTTITGTTPEIDTDVPVIASVTPSNTIVSLDNEGVDGFSVSIAFETPMNQAITEVVSFDPALATTFTNCGGAWTNSTLLVYTCDVVNVGANQPAVDVIITGAETATGNGMVAPETVTGVFAVDHLRPTIVDVTVPSMLNAAFINDTFTIAVEFSEPMWNGTPIVIAFNPPLTLLTDCAGSWDSVNTTWTHVCAVEDELLEQADVDVVISNGRDRAGNEMLLVDETYSFSIDAILPTAVTVSIASVNANTSLARVGDEIIILFTVSETLDSTPSATIAGVAATVTSLGGLDYQATHTFAGAEPEGVVEFTIDFTDEAGNEAITITQTTDGSSVIFDETPPTVESVRVTGEQEVTLTFSESVTGVVEATIDTFDGALDGCIVDEIAGSGAEYVFTLTDCGPFATDATGELNVVAGAIADLAGNAFAGQAGVVVTDGQPPTQTGLGVSSITQTGATITITTDEDATCRVATTSIPYADMTDFATTGELSHTTALSGLTAGTSYTARVACADGAGNIATTQTQAFTTTASSTGGSGGGGGGGGGGGAPFSGGGTLPPTSGPSTATFGIGNVVVGETKTINVNRDQIAFTAISFESGVAIATNVVVSVTSVDVNAMPMPLPNRAYQYLEIEYPTNLEANSASFSFRIHSDWINVNGIEPTNVALFRFQNGAWEPMPTEFVRQEGNHFVFSSNAPGLSQYAIGEREAPEQEEQPAPAEPEPVPEIVLQQESEPELEEEVAPPEEVVEERSSRAWLWALVAVIVLAGLILGGFRYKRSREREEAYRKYYEHHYRK